MEEDWSNFHRKHHSTKYRRSQIPGDSNYNENIQHQRNLGNKPGCMRCVLGCVLKPFSNSTNTQGNRRRTSLSVPKKTQQQNDGEYWDDDESHVSSEFGYTFPSDKLQVPFTAVKRLE